MHGMNINYSAFVFMADAEGKGKNPRHTFSPLSVVLIDTFLASSLL
jgi:hypothetical protein